METYRSNLENLLDYIAFFRLCLRLPKEPALADEAANWAAGLAAQETAGEPASAMARLRACLSLDGCAWFCAALAVCSELDGGVRNGIQALTGSPVVTLDLAGSLYGMATGGTDPAELMSLAGGPLEYVLAMEQGQQERPYIFTPLLPRKNVLRFVTAGTVGPGAGYELLAPGDDTLPLHESVRALFAGAETGSLLFLSGPSGAGKRTLAARLASPCLAVDLDSFAALDGERQRSLAYEWSLDAMLCGGLACVNGYRAQWARELRELCSLLKAQTRLLILSAEENCPLPHLRGRDTLARRIGTLCTADFTVMRTALEKAYGGGEDLPDYRFTAGQMREVWREAAGAARLLNRPPQKEDFARAVRARAAAEAAEPADECLADLVVSPETVRKLEMVCALARNRQRTDARLRAAGIPPYGKGVSALFYGPSGTGKTMAARAVSKELGMALWRVDLSQVLDKYIGETEKHLAKIFAAAEKQNALLFFDEADALFSKRSEIGSSHDRYANIETAFLLQGMEAYDGIILLATNLYKNFDPAFLRRINVVVRFSLPDAALRRELWQRSLPPDCLDKHVDLEWLAQELEMAPAAIRSAAHTALGLGNGHISGENLAGALRNELEKAGQDLSPDLLRALTDPICKPQRCPL